MLGGAGRPAEGCYETDGRVAFVLLIACLQPGKTTSSVKRRDMARDTHDREDLLRDAIGYVRRVEFTSPDRKEPVFCGFRECGALSIYVGQDNVLQFNTDGELRRAFWRDRILASYRRTLHWLDRSDGQVRLTRTRLSDDDSSAFVASAKNWLRQLHQELAEKKLTIRGQVPEEADVAGQIFDWLRHRNEDLCLAMHPGLALSKRRDS